MPASCPQSFLRLCEGGPRGFWASGDRWVAHGGLTGRVAVEHDAVDAGEARFRSVNNDVAELFRGLADPDARPRVFGGFSFWPGDRIDPIWSSFPPALFHLPEVELEHDPSSGTCTLVVRGATTTAARRSWDRWAASLERMPARGRSGRLAVGSAGVDSLGGTHRRPYYVPRVGAFGTDRATWGRMIWQALSRIRAGDAEKVVLARALEVAPGAAVEPADLVAALWAENHGSHVFLFEPVPGEVVVGAAPETIATLVGGVVRATAVAGSARVGSDSVETAQLARGLFNSEKDRAEHDFVVRDMVARLRALGCTVHRDVEAHVLALARIQHLETKIAAEVPPGTSLLDILESLHPTPAVCGIPRDVALSVIAEGEVFDRGWYAGPVGWFDSEGKGIFVPALRSAVRSGDRWRLFAGSGIVPGSDPALEWEETELKFRPVLRAIARAGAGESTAAGTG